MLILWVLFCFSLLFIQKCVSNQVLYFILRIFIYPSTSPLSHTYKNTILVLFIWKRNVIEQKFHITVSENIFPLMYPLYPSSSPSPPLPHFSRSCFWIRFHFTLKVAKRFFQKIWRWKFIYYDFSLFSSNKSQANSSISTQQLWFYKFFICFPTYFLPV